MSNSEDPWTEAVVYSQFHLRCCHSKPKTVLFWKILQMEKNKLSVDVKTTTEAPVLFV